jgi:RNA 2',3'-cyclic 3'-phosphodiesterase
MAKRLFAAIRISPDVNLLDQLHQLEQHLSHERIKWVEDHNIHITLKFFGETDEDKIPEIEDVLKRVAEENHAFGFRLHSLGVFGSKYDPRVLWIGIEPYEHLVELMKDLNARLDNIGYEPDRQNLVPHLTIGRIKQIKDKQGFQKIIENFREIRSKEMSTTGFILYESILKKEGPVYHALNTFQFSK